MKRVPNFYTEVGTSLPRDPAQWLTRQVEFYQDSFTRTERITVAICTFNVNSKKPSGDLAPWLRLDETPAIIAVGLQELDMSANALLRGETEAQGPWRDVLCSVIGADNDSRSIAQSYYLLGCKQMVGLYLAVFLHKANYLVSRNVKMSVVSTGAMMGALGNKGGIALRLQIHRSSLIFVNSHLAAHMSEVDKRNKDFQSIIAGIQMENSDPSLPLLMAKDHDVIFFFGDLNYRVERFSYEQAIDLVKAKNWDALLEEDQLRKELSRHATMWKGFREALPNFPPTYRYDTGTCNFDTSEKKRIPAYTDRILWWTKQHRKESKLYVEENVRVKSFSSFPEILLSDHKPVSALLDVAVLVEVDSDRTKIHEELRQQVNTIGFDKIIIPKIDISVTSINFESVLYGSTTSRSIVVENKGQSVVQMGVSLLRQEGKMVGAGGSPVTMNPNPKVPNVPSWKWVSVDPMDQIIFPGDRCTFAVDCVVDREASEFFESHGPFEGTEGFSSKQWLVLQAKGGPPNYIELTTQFIPSCFGNTLENLIRLGSKPCRVAYCQTAAEAPIVSRPRVPKELWAMVDFIFQNGAKTADLFQTFKADDIPIIRDWLDTKDTVFPPNFCDIHGMATALTAFLRDLQQPVIPYAQFHAIASCPNTNPKGYVQVLSELRPVHYNVFAYLISFFRFLLRSENSAQNGLTVDVLATSFTQIILQRPPRENPHFREYSPDEVRFLNQNTLGFMTYYLTAENCALPQS
eukprot:PhF_6_TR27801/c0_g1_i1/m.40502/K01099/INPP5B_F; inositol polyphosphate 5-phosphatase INPP5B/F